MIENKNVNTADIVTVEKEEKEKETIEMKKKVTVIFKKEDCERVKNDVNVVSLFADAVPAHMLTPNAVTTAVIRALDLKSKNFRAEATAIYRKQLEQYNDTAFDCLNGKTIMVGYAIMNALIQKLVAIGFEVATELPTVQKIDRWGEGQPHGYEKYFKGSYAAQIVSGSLTESNLSVRGKGMEDMYQVNCALCDGDKLIATAYTYVRAGSIGSAKRVVEIVFGEHYNADIKACFKNDLVEKPGIFTIKDTEKARKAVTAARKNNGVMYTKAAREEQQSAQQITTLETELAKRDSRITDLETAVAKLQKVVAALTDGKTVVQKPENDPEPEDPKPSSTPAGDEDNWDDDDWETPAHCEDVLMNPDVKQETTPEPEEPDVSTSNDKEQTVPEEQSAQEEPVKKEEEPIVLSDEDITLIGSFFKPVSLAEPSQAVLDYDAAMADYVARRIEMYTELVKATRLLGCDIVDLQNAVKKDFRPNGLKIEAIAIKNDKVYVRANKCGRGGRAFYRVVKNEKVKVLQDDFIKISDF